MKWAMLLLFALPVFAHVDIEEEDYCVPLRETLADKLLDWFSANDSQIKNAPCKTKSPPSLQDMQKYIDSIAFGMTNGSVNGASFKLEAPQLLSAFTDLVTLRDAYGIRPEKTQPDIQERYKINPECEKVMCAMEKIWGKETAIKMMYIKLKYNFNTSELAFQDSERFRRDELDDVLMALEDLPPHLSKLGARNQRLTRFTKGYTLARYEDHSPIANAVIMLFDPWVKQKKEKRQYTIFHELAHNVSHKLKDMDESTEWLGLTGWIQKGDDWQEDKNNCYPSGYAATNPWEDYAESLSAYRYNGARFKQLCPEKYNFIKSKVFNNIEYTDAKTCGQFQTSQP